MGKFLVLIGLGLFSAGGCFAADVVVTPADIAEGHRLSLNLCGACHIVSADQRDLPVLKSNPPFFFEIANNPQMTESSIRSFLEKTHWDFRTRPVTMPTPELDEGQKNAVIAYILSLKR